MLQTARRRVGRLSATLALLIVAGFVSNLVRAALGLPSDSILDQLILSGLMVVICLIPWWLARSSRRSDFTVLSSALPWRYSSA
jgi:hypothetical protein